MILYERQTTSEDVNPEGAIRIVHIHTPHAQLNEISCADRRLTILTIKGILKNGKITAANKLIVFKTSPFK